MKNAAGFVGLEMAFFFALIGGTLFWLHVELMERGNEKLEKVDRTRIRYTGEKLWKP